jgi:hypothetical protein
MEITLIGQFLELMYFRKYMRSPFTRVGNNIKTTLFLLYMCLERWCFRLSFWWIIPLFAIFCRSLEIKDPMLLTSNVTRLLLIENEEYRDGESRESQIKIKDESENSAPIKIFLQQMTSKQQEETVE